MKTLVIAEKPDMGRTIAAVIEPKAKNNRTYLEGEQYIITWAIGHLLGWLNRMPMIQSTNVGILRTC